LAGELIDEYGDEVESITLTKGSSGRFDVSVDGQLIFSKQQEKRHANPGEIVERIAASAEDQVGGWSPAHSTHTGK